MLAGKHAQDEKKPAEAVAAYDKLVALKQPIPNEFWYFYGLALRDVGRFSDARSALLKYVKLTGDTGRSTEAALLMLDQLDVQIEKDRARAEAERIRAEAERTRAEAAAAARVAAERFAAEHPRFKDCDVCPEMVGIPAGSFDMGSPPSEAVGYDNENPVRRVTLKRFALGRTEVTQGQWRALMGGFPSRYTFKNCGDDCPIEAVSWDNARAYVQKLSERTGKTYRLPSEAEWEYACRAGSRTTYCGGDDVDNVAWYRGNSSPITHRVGEKAPNAWGLFDMSGNVYEWVQDCWNGSYTAAPSDGSAWENYECTARVIRGGSYFAPRQFLRAAFRTHYGQVDRDLNIGFRVAMTEP